MSAEARALAALDEAALLGGLSALVRVPSLTGAERPVMELLAAQAESAGLEGAVVEHDLAALRAHPDHPGEEVARDELVGAVATLRGTDPAAPRLCLDGHLDVVDPGAEPWSRDPFSGEIAGGALHGRGAVDMKAGVAAALYAMGALARAGVRPPGDVVLHAVSSEEDGGLGTFAALEADDAFAAAVIPEPTGWGVCCAQAGALTFRAVVPGVGAHAAVRLEGVSAIDRYVPVHAALQDHERVLNTGVEHPLMAALPLPYPLSVGRLEAGSWSSSVPDRLVVEGRLGVRVGESPADARAAFERVVLGACPEARVDWPGGAFWPGETRADAPVVALVRDALGDERGTRPPLTGVPYGADMRLFCARDIPCVMVGTPGLELAHAVDERVPVADVITLARTLVRVLVRFGR